MRNAAFTTINPKTGELWGTEMGRDYLGDNLPPDEINIIQQGNVSLARPVDLAFDTFGNLYISDDKTGNVYIVQKSN